MQGQNTGRWCWAVNLTADSKQWKLNSETTKHIKNVVGSPSVPFKNLIDQILKDMLWLKQELAQGIPVPTRSDTDDHKSPFDSYST